MRSCIAAGVCVQKASYSRARAAQNVSSVQFTDFACFMCCANGFFFAMRWHTGLHILASSSYYPSPPSIIWNCTVDCWCRARAKQYCCSARPSNFALPDNHGWQAMLTALSILLSYSLEACHRHFVQCMSPVAFILSCSWMCDLAACFFVPVYTRPTAEV